MQYGQWVPNRGHMAKFQCFEVFSGFWMLPWLRNLWKLFYSITAAILISRNESTLSPSCSLGWIKTLTFLLKPKPPDINSDDGNASDTGWQSKPKSNYINRWYLHSLKQSASTATLLYGTLVHTLPVHLYTHSYTLPVPFSCRLSWHWKVANHQCI